MPAKAAMTNLRAPPRLGLFPRSRWQARAAAFRVAAIHIGPPRGCRRSTLIHGRRADVTALTLSRTLCWRGRAQALPFFCRGACRALRARPMSGNAPNRWTIPRTPPSRSSTCRRSSSRRLRCSSLVHGAARLVLTRGAGHRTPAAVRVHSGALRRAVLARGAVPGGLGAQIWTFVTYALIHGDWTHLGLNARVAARLRHAGRAPLRRAALSRVLRRDGGGGRGRASCHASGDASCR